MNATLRARQDDVAAMSRVLMASINELCIADHGNEARKLAAWTRNKSVEGVGAMLANPDFEMHVAERDGEVIAVGAVTSDGTIALNYVAPWARFSGVSTMMLNTLEVALIAMGHKEARLESTRTAMEFYTRRGWVVAGPQATGRVVNGFPMIKTLNAD